MPFKKLMRWSGLSLLMAGIANVLFWVLVIPIGTFSGTAAALHALWVPSQFLHVLAALFALFGLVGLYTQQENGNGWLGLSGFVLALFGTAFYLADGVIALVIFPLAAANAPALVAENGALHTSPAYVVFAVTFMFGYILFGINLLREKKLPNTAVLLLIIGAILANLPPAAVPLAILILGGVVWGIGAAWLGYILRSAKT